MLVFGNWGDGAGRARRGRRRHSNAGNYTAMTRCIRRAVAWGFRLPAALRGASQDAIDLGAR